MRPTRCFYIEGMGLPAPGWICCRPGCATYNAMHTFKCKVCARPRCEPLDPMPPESHGRLQTRLLEDVRARVAKAARVTADPALARHERMRQLETELVAAEAKLTAAYNFACDIFNELEELDALNELEGSKKGETDERK